MKNKNFTIADLVNEERDMVLTAEQKYGEYFTHSTAMVSMMNNLVPSMDKPSRFLFVVFLSAVKKHLTLALFSVVRRHHVEAGMNLRQVLENSAWAAYALVYEDVDLFQVKDAIGHVSVPKRLGQARNTWLTQNYPEKSKEIQRLKEKINTSVAHANIAYAFQTFEFVTETERSGFATPYFDIEDEFRIKADLLMVANFAMGMIDLFIGVNQNERVFQLPQDFSEKFKTLIDQHNQLRADMQAHPRMKAAAGVAAELSDQTNRTG